MKACDISSTTTGGKNDAYFKLSKQPKAEENVSTVQPTVKENVNRAQTTMLNIQIK